MVSNRLTRPVLALALTVGIVLPGTFALADSSGTPRMKPRWTGTRWTDSSWTGTRWTDGGWS